MLQGTTQPLLKGSSCFRPGVAAPTAPVKQIKEPICVSAGLVLTQIGSLICAAGGTAGRERALGKERHTGTNQEFQGGRAAVNLAVPGA